MSAIVIDAVRKSFGAITVLKDVSLTVRDQEFLVLLGPPDAARPRFCASSQASNGPAAAASSSANGR